MSRLNSKFLFEMTLQLHVKVSARYGELKFQFGLARSEESSYLLNNLGQQLTSFHPTIHQWKQTKFTLGSDNAHLSYSQVYY